MSLGRRQFLRGSLSTGALVFAVPLGLVAEAGTLPDSAEHAVNSAGLPIVILRCAGDEAFALPALAVANRYCRSPTHELPLHDGIVGAPGSLPALLEQYRGARLVGIMDDFTHVLVEETVRDLGGSVLCRGRHCGLTTSSVGSRHTFATTATTRGIGARIARAMLSDSADFLVQEHCAGSAAADDMTLTPGEPASWAQALGASYALMAAGMWRNGPVLADERRGAAAAHPRSQTFVSLVAEI